LEVLAVTYEVISSPDKMRPISGGLVMMDKFISRVLAEFEGGKITRRQLIQTIAGAAALYSAGAGVEAEAASTLGLRTISVNHISYGCPDYTKARDFYVKLFGMDYPADMDSGGQACLPFGPKVSATFLLPRGGRDPNAPPAPPRGAGGAAAAANAGGGGGAARGAGGGGGRGGNPPDPCADVIAAERAAALAARGGGAGGGGRGGGGRGGGRGGDQPPRPPVTNTVDQLGFTVANWDPKKIEAALKRFGLDPKPDKESFHVTDPYGLDIMICGPKWGAY
jgi:catechol 2,3-dioxygenase-like lactoylglutathione lyase family enzyme